LVRYQRDRGLVPQARFSEFIESILRDTYQPVSEGLH